MEKGRRWGAILLIDEADVYLEERTPQGLERNGLVSGKYHLSSACTCLTVVPISLLEELRILPRNSLPYNQPCRRF
jgi:hypothetical protein